MKNCKSYIVSACLLGEPCRYNGEKLKKKLQTFPAGSNVIPVCPEVDGGLPVPREPAEIDSGNGNKVIEGNTGVLTCTRRDVTVQFLSGAAMTLEVVKKNSPCTIILKSRSPSCGSGQIYDGTFTGTLKPGDGVTSALLKKNGFTVYNENNLPDVLKE